MRDAPRRGSAPVADARLVVEGDQCLDLFEERGATFVPTLAIMHRLVTRGADHGVPDYGLRKAEDAREAQFEATRRAYEAGAPIAVGTDFLGPDLIPHGENALSTFGSPGKGPAATFTRTGVRIHRPLRPPDVSLPLSAGVDGLVVEATRGWGT